VKLRGVKLQGNSKAALSVPRAVVHTLRRTLAVEIATKDRDRKQIRAID
jgi:hypothetical protein